MYTQGGLVSLGIGTVLGISPLRLAKKWRIISKHEKLLIKSKRVARRQERGIDAIVKCSASEVN